MKNHKEKDSKFQFKYNLSCLSEEWNLRKKTLNFKTPEIVNTTVRKKNFNKDFKFCKILF